MTINDVKTLKVARVKCDQSLLFFTRYFFKKKFNRKFVVNSHHKLIADKLEKVLSGEITRLIINIAPRYGKTELAVKNFIAHSLGLNPSAKFIHLSYADDLALDNSEEIRDMILSDEFKQLYGNIEIKKDSKSKKKWRTNSGGGVYATSSGGQVTGFGAGAVDDEEKEIDEALSYIETKQEFNGAIVIDDPIKPDDAESDTIRDRVNNKFDSTIRNRVNSRNTPIIVIMQRLHPLDLCGHLIKNDVDDWEVLSLPCITNVDGEEAALWDFKHTLTELKALRGKTSASINIFDRQYMQNPKPLEGLLYSSFKTYSSIDFDIGVVSAYCDTADTGADFLCMVVYTEHNKMKYVLDVVYSDRANEITEPIVTDCLIRNGVNMCMVESNNGGRAFARNIERMLRSQGRMKTNVRWFHQSKNKEARIKSNSTLLMNTVLFPDNWSSRWSEYYDAMNGYMAKGKNKHDDAPDATTGIVEPSKPNNNNLIGF